MIQPALDTYRFHLGRSSYLRISVLSVLMLASLLTCALIALVLSNMLLPTYMHNFTPYLKWQDALVALLWFITFISLGGSIFVVRFLYALHCGYTKGMLILVKDNALTVRDLAAENLGSIFWIMNSSFWCFVAVLVGLLPSMLIGWTMHLAHPILAAIATGAAVMLSLGGLIISVVAGSFIVVGCIGVISFCRKLGAAHTYALSSHAVFRIDNYVLTITCPGTPESMLDLRLLAQGDASLLLALLHEHGVNVQHAPLAELDKEIEAAREVPMLA
jgi:hypothetical protein